MKKRFGIIKLTFYICGMETVNEKMTMIRLSQINDKYPDLIKHILFTCDETFTLKESLSVNVSIQLHRSWEDEILWETYQRTEFPNFRVAYELDSKHYHFYKMTYESFRKERISETEKMISKISSMVQNIPHDFDLSYHPQY